MTSKQAEFFPIYSGEIVSITPQITQSFNQSVYTLQSKVFILQGLFSFMPPPYGGSQIPSHPLGICTQRFARLQVRKKEVARQNLVLLGT